MDLLLVRSGQSLTAEDPGACKLALLVQSTSDLLVRLRGSSPG